jgi:hypothetical protein
MATCPSGHQSASDDYCDVCGMLIGAAVLAPLVQAPGQVPGQVPFQAPGGISAAEGGCPRCGVPRAGQFCESCGYDFTIAAPHTPGPGAYQTASPPPVPPAAASQEWAAMVSADRAYYDAVQEAGGPDAAGIAFPAYCPQRRFRLAGTEVRIGRHSVSSGIDPEIDLSVAPADPGVSRLHAVLLKAPDGTWSVVDPGSANGTAVNGSEIPRGVAVPLREGDRIHLGAWTQLRVSRGA